MAGKAVKRRASTPTSHNVTGVDLPPPELWMLARLGEREPMTLASIRGSARRRIGRVAGPVDRDGGGKTGFLLRQGLQEPHHAADGIHPSANAGDDRAGQGPERDRHQGARGRRKNPDKGRPIVRIAGESPRHHPSLGTIAYWRYPLIAVLTCSMLCSVISRARCRDDPFWHAGARVRHQTCRSGEWPSTPLRTTGAVLSAPAGAGARPPAGLPISRATDARASLAHRLSHWAISTDQQLLSRPVARTEGFSSKSRKKTGRRKMQRVLRRACHAANFSHAIEAYRLSRPLIALIERCYDAHSRRRAGIPTRLKHHWPNP